MKGYIFLSFESEDILPMVDYCLNNLQRRDYNKTIRTKTCIKTSHSHGKINSKTNLCKVTGAMQPTNIPRFRIQKQTGILTLIVYYHYIIGWIKGIRIKN